MRCSKTTKIISVLLFLFFCAASFIGGAIFGKKYGYQNAYKQGYLSGKMDIFNAVTRATGYKISEAEDCEPITSFKADAISVCTINGVKKKKKTD